MKNFLPGANLYCLVLYHELAESIEIGALGEVYWKKGWTYYVGRASRGWSSRLRRLTDEDRSRHWHIDYLTVRTSSIVAYIVPFNESGNRECELAGWLGERETIDPIAEGFGSSDCGSSCSAHGFHSESMPPETVFQSVIDRFSAVGYVSVRSNLCRWVTLE